MQSRNVLLALGAAILTAAQNTTLAYNATGLADTIPTCGVDCLTEAASSHGCGSTNYKCQCEHYGQIQASAEICLDTNCTYSETTTTSQATFQICELLLIDEYPECSTECIAEGAEDAGCDSFDSSCLCREEFALQEDMAYCLANNCTPDEMTAADSISESLCNLVNAASIGAPSMASNTTGTGRGQTRVHSNATTTGFRVVDSFTTWCPKATVVTYDDEEYTATEATMLTVTNCPCTITTTGAAYATNNATMTMSGTNATTTSGTMEASDATTTSEASETGATSSNAETSDNESSSTGESGAAEESGSTGGSSSTSTGKTVTISTGDSMSASSSGSGASEFLGESTDSGGSAAGSGAAGTTMGSSESAMATYAQSGASEYHAGIQVGLVAALASVFVMGW